MQPPILKTYRPEMPLGENVFYIQSKGNNSGRPLMEPIRNCFVAYCESQDHMDYWMCICTVLFIGKKFGLIIRGSVIPFIRICDTLWMFRAFRNVDEDKLYKAASQLKEVDEALRLNAERTRLLEQLRMVTVQAFRTLL